MAKCLTVVTRWLVTQDSVWYQREQKSSSHCAINASVVDGMTWKSSGIAVQLNVNCYYYIFTYYLLTSLLTYLPIYLLTYLFTYLLAYLLTYLLTYFLAYLLTYLFGSGFGGLEVACWRVQTRPKLSDFFRAKKSSAPLPSEGK